MRALVLGFPWLGIDLWLREAPDLRGRPLALIERRGARDWLVACSPEAVAAGVRPGFALSEALAKVELTARPDDPALERLALERLALWAYERWSPRVALLSGSPVGEDERLDALLIDLAGTERLHPEDEVVARVRSACAAVGLRVRLALADGPAAAAALARYASDEVRLPGGGQGIEAAHGLEAALGPLPPEALRASRETLRRLRALGLVRLEQLRALPADALPSRLGDALLVRLDELYGRRDPELRWFLPEEVFQGRFQFPEGARPDRQDLGRAMQPLAEDLARTLEERHRLALNLALSFLQDPPPAAPAPDLELRLTAPSRDPADLARLLRTLLERARLDALVAAHPVSELRLRALETCPARLRQVDLFDPRAEAERRARTELASLLSGLEVLLGPGRVVSVEPVPDPRPERAVRERAVSEAWADAGRRAAELPPPALERGPRPLRLLLRPQRVSVIAAADGAPLTVSEDGQRWRVAEARGPERIETGWWEEPARRDYWVVRDEGGRAVWVFRDLDREPPEYFLHGVFE